VKRVLDRFYVNSSGNPATEGDPASVHLDEDRTVERTGPGDGDDISGVDPKLLQVATEPPTALDSEDTRRLSCSELC